MPSFFFWNLYNKPRAKLISLASLAYSIDVFIFAECIDPPNDIVNDLNAVQSNRFYYEVHPNLNTKIKIITRLPLGCVDAISDDGGVSIRHIKPPIGADIILVAAHLPSKIRNTPDDQLFRVERLSRQIIGAEDITRSQNTVVIGDLNMNPFETPMVAASGLHGMQDKAVALKRSRAVGGEVKRFFYNPMWSRLGDESIGPPGTYYYNSGSAVNNYWNCFDQVLIRPSLIGYYSHKNLNIITDISGNSLLKNGSIDKTISDHLPLLIDLKTERVTS